MKTLTNECVVHKYTVNLKVANSVLDRYIVILAKDKRSLTIWAKNCGYTHLKVLKSDRKEYPLGRCFESIQDMMNQQQMLINGRLEEGKLFWEINNDSNSK